MEKKIKLSEKQKLGLRLTKSISKATESAYKMGAIDAMSTAVNVFNCEPQIREQVFKKMKIKP